MEPSVDPQIGDKVSVVNTMNDHWLDGVITHKNEVYIHIECHNGYNVSIPINWYREKWGWMWSNDP